MGNFVTERLHDIEMPGDGIRVELAQPLVWVADDERRFCVPQGFVTDFASIPRLFWRILPPWDIHKKAAVLHDWLYTEQCVSKQRADAYFYEAMGDLGVPGWKRWAMWAAVASCGFVAWGEHARKKAARTAGLLGLWVVLMMTSACGHSISYTDPSGAMFKRTAPPWANLQFDSLQVTVATNGTKTLKMDGYKLDLQKGWEAGLQAGKELGQALIK